jgi:hypothetical protein
METKFTKGKWKDVDGVLFDENNNTVPSKTNFSASGRITKDEYFKNDEFYIEAKYNDLLKSKAPEMFEMLVKINTYLSEIEKTNNFKFISDAIGNIRIGQLLKEATEL